MIDIALIRESPDEIAAALRKWMLQVDFTELLAWDERRRSAVGESESLKAERNRVSRHIGAAYTSFFRGCRTYPKPTFPRVEKRTTRH